MTSEMVNVETFISNAYISGCKDNAHEFISIRNNELMERVNWDSTYLSGAILLRYNDEALLGFSNCDVIDFSWIMLFHGIRDILSKGKASVSSSAEGFSIELESLPNNKILIDTYNNKVTLSKKEFLYSTLEAAEEFFNTVRTYIHCRSKYADC